jgi:hypothetical protein
MSPESTFPMSLNPNQKFAEATGLHLQAEKSSTTSLAPTSRSFVATMGSGVAVVRYVPRAYSPETDEFTTSMP